MQKITGVSTMKLAVVVMVQGILACSTKVDLCKGDADCTDPAYPFCDVNGEYTASGGEKGVCTIVPPDCPVDRCGCTPGAVTCGADGELTTCNADGASTTIVTCPLGCEADGTACMTFDPLNGLGTPLKASNNEPDIALPPMVTIDTDTGNIVDGSGGPVIVDSVVITQSTGDIRVFIGKSFKIENATVTGKLGVAFVAEGAIELDGVFDASANMSTPGPGGLDLPATSVGADNLHGGGGGGNATVGGDGGKKSTSLGFLFGPGGALQTTFEPLTGGGRGGSGTGNPTPATGAGGGGGGVEIVSLTSIAVRSGGLIDLGGGGGFADASNGSGGGGAGGTAILEAPTVTVDGTIVANGGSGGVTGSNGSMPCAHPGSDGTRTSAPAAGSSCNSGESSGSGGTGSVAATAAGVDSAGAAGGGGAVGRVFIATGDGSVHQTGLVSAAITTQKLMTR